MEEPGAAAVPPPLPPKTKPPRSRSPFSTASSSSSFSSSTAAVGGHVVKILISPQQEREAPAGPCIRISVNADAMADTGGYFFFNQYNGCVMSSGQVSPSDTLDSGTCSDMDGTPPPPQKKKAAAVGGVSVTLIGSHKRASSTSSGAEVDSDDNESNSSSISCDSLNSENVSPPPKPASPTPLDPKPHTPTLISVSPTLQALPTATKPSSTIPKPPPLSEKNGGPAAFLPATLLQDIRQRSVEKQENHISPTIVDEKTYEDRKQAATTDNICLEPLNPDMFYNFHINEHDSETLPPLKMVVEDETFAGYRDLLGDGASTIRSAKGTVRGVKNRVRAGIATFLQIQTTGKNYKEKEAGKVVVYSTTMGILRDTYQACNKVKQIMRTLLVKFEERDVFMSSEYQAEIRERMSCDHILVPQVFVDGQHVGDAETIERLNESGELRRILKPFKSLDACTTCQTCGGYRLLPCPACRGSKKSVHRNHFTTEFVALKCMNCDEVGLVKCTNC